MTVKKLAELFDQYSDGEYLEFDRIPNNRRLHHRPDLNAFLLLDRLAGEKKGKGRDMVIDARYEEFYLGVQPKDIARAATEDDIIDLIRCGLRYDSDTESFCMFS